MCVCVCVFGGVAVRACVCVCVCVLESGLLGGQPSWFALYQWRAEKRLPRDVLDTLPTYARLVFDVTETDCR